MLITALLDAGPEGYQEPHNEVRSQGSAQSRPSPSVEFESWEGVKVHCGKVRVTYLSYRTVVDRKGGSFAK